MTFLETMLAVVIGNLLTVAFVYGAVDSSRLIGNRDASTWQGNVALLVSILAFAGSLYFYMNN